MSGTKRRNQLNPENYKTPLQRDAIQEKLLGTIERMKSPTVTQSDEDAFFGGIEDAEYAPARVSGIFGLEDKQNRLTMARLYMLKQGVSLETIFSQDEEAIKIKRQMGQNFRDIIFNGTPTEVRTEWAAMTKCLNDVVIHPADLVDDQTFTDNYLAMAFYRDAALAHRRSMGQSKKPEERQASNIWERHVALERENFSATCEAMSAINMIMDTTALKITDESYSSANSAKRDSLKGVFPYANATQDYKNFRIFVGHELLEEFEIFFKSDLANLNVPLRDLKGLAAPLEQVWNKDFSGEKGIYPDEYDAVFEDLMDFEELSIDEIARPELITDTVSPKEPTPATADAAAKTAKELLTLKDFHMEVETIKHTKNQAEVREALKIEAQNMAKGKPKQPQPNKN